MRFLLAALQSPQEVEEALAEVFARREFAPPDSFPFWEWVVQGLGAVVDFLRSLFPNMSFGESGHALVFWAVVSLLALFGALVVTRAARRIRGRLPARRRRAEAPQRAAGSPTPATAEEWDRRAGELAAQNRWREAALALYQAVLHRLADDGAVRVDPAKTPGDYRRESRRHPEYSRLDRFLRLLEPVAFGARGANADAYARLVEVSRTPTASV